MCDGVGDNDLEPLSGIGPLSGGLEVFAEFFRIDTDLVRAAAETSAGVADERIPPEAVRAALAPIPEGEKTEWLHRLAEGDPHVGAGVATAYGSPCCLRAGRCRRECEECPNCEHARRRYGKKGKPGKAA